jgi:hypothetical protein
MPMVLSARFQKLAEVFSFLLLAGGTEPATAALFGEKEKSHVAEGMLDGTLL